MASSFVVVLVLGLFRVCVRGSSLSSFGGEGRGEEAAVTTIL